MINKEEAILKFRNEKMYSDTLFKRLNSILRSSSSVIKSNKKRRQSIYENLKQISLLKNYTELFENKQRKYFIERYPKQYKIFEEILIREFSKKIERVDSAPTNK